jgi:hypothetical protein
MVMVTCGINGAMAAPLSAAFSSRWTKAHTRRPAARGTLTTRFMPTNYYFAERFEVPKVSLCQF